MNLTNVSEDISCFGLRIYRDWLYNEYIDQHNLYIDEHYFVFDHVLHYDWLADQARELLTQLNDPMHPMYINLYEELHWARGQMRIQIYHLIEYSNDHHYYQRDVLMELNKLNFLLNLDQVEELFIPHIPESAGIHVEIPPIYRIVIGE